MEFLRFLSELYTILWSSFQYAEKQEPDPEIEKQLQIEYIRKLSDYRAKRDLEKLKENS